MSNFADRRHSEARNFETAQHIEKQIKYVSFIYNKCATKQYQTWGITHGILMLPREKIAMAT